jgi:N-acetylglucosamine-6-phosphate deacetylase
MPTLITCAGERMRQAADAVIEAWGMAGLLGVHIEGPHIAAARKGTHSAAFIRPMDNVTLDVLERLRRRGVPVMLTLAPEVVSTCMVRRIAELGVVISAGHSAASAEATRAGIDAGIACFTHLYNAMPPMTSRDPGILGAAINSDAFAGVIVDGHHVAWEMVRLACRARPLAQRMFMVSDAMATIGGPEHFELYGERIEVRDGALVNAAGSLAGAHIDLVGCVGNAVRHVGLSIEEAYAMAATVPRDAMRLDKPEISAGQSLSEVLALTEELARVAI